MGADGEVEGGRVMLNIAVGVFCAIVGWWMCALALGDKLSVPRWVFALLAVLNLSLAVLNVMKGVGGWA